MQKIIEGPAANVVKRTSSRVGQTLEELVAKVQEKGFALDEKAIKILQAADLDVAEEKEIVLIYPQDLGLRSSDLEPVPMIELGKELGLEPFLPGLIDELCEGTDLMDQDAEILIPMELVHTDEDYNKSPDNGFALRIYNHNGKDQLKTVWPMWVATRENPKQNYPWAFVKTPKKK